MTRYIATFGRVFLGLLFVAIAASEILDRPDMAVRMIAERGVVFPMAVYSTCLAIFLGGGLALIAGYGVRMAAALLTLLLLAINFAMFDFWTVPPGTPGASMEAVLFVMNVAIACGLLGFLGNGSGPLALENVLHMRNTAPVE